MPNFVVSVCIPFFTEGPTKPGSAPDNVYAYKEYKKKQQK